LIGYIDGTFMHFSRETAGEANAIIECTGAGVRLRDRVVRGSVILTRTSVLHDWRPPPPESLTLADFSDLLALAPDVVLLGTGACQRLPSPELYDQLAVHGIGLEVMDNRAACRTYNVLLGEYRNVAIALMLDNTDGAGGCVELFLGGGKS
jgi:uncharacterized protein